MLLLVKGHIDTLIEQTKTRPQETLQFKQSRQKESFSSNPLINMVDEGKWLIAVKSFEATNFVFNLTDENNSFSINTPSYWTFRGVVETINKLQKLLDMRQKNVIELNVEKSTERGI